MQHPRTYWGADHHRPHNPLAVGVTDNFGPNDLALCVANHLGAYSFAEHLANLVRSNHVAIRLTDDVGPNLITNGIANHLDAGPDPVHIALGVRRRHVLRRQKHVLYL